MTDTAEDFGSLCKVCFRDIYEEQDCGSVSKLEERKVHAFDRATTSSCSGCAEKIVLVIVNGIWQFL